MLNKIYQLVRPRQFELVYRDITLEQDQILVRPGYLSICNADQRYYQGTRPEKVLSEKLPMALIHEAVGEVLFDPRGEFSSGEMVVMIPNSPVESDEIISENYLPSSLFRASGHDGFMQEYVAMDRDRLVRLPEGISPELAAFTEFVSVSHHGITRFGDMSHQRRNEIGVWGDGNMGYVTALLLKVLYPDTKIYVFGINEYKLGDFSFADRIYNVNEVPQDLAVDHAFECVGGSPSAAAINQIIDVIRPEGSISLLGVSEDPAPINTRMVLEKGLKLFGSSRSDRRAFEEVAKLYGSEPGLTSQLEKIISSCTRVHSIADVTKAFERDIHKVMGKTIMKWEP